MSDSTKLALTSIGVLVALGIVFVPYSNEEMRSEVVAHSTDYAKSDNYELGEEHIEEDGINGETEVTEERTGTLLQRVLFSNTVKAVELDRETVLRPATEKVLEGTKRFRYMYCSDNTYFYFDEKAWKDEQNGYTSKSEDDCADDGKGPMVRLANEPPAPIVQRPRCIDVTSIDYNWDNDVLCTNPDGSTYYTSYAGAGW